MQTTSACSYTGSRHLPYNAKPTESTKRKNNKKKTYGEMKAISLLFAMPAEHTVCKLCNVVIKYSNKNKALTERNLCQAAMLTN